MKGVKRVAMHEPLTNIRKVLLVQFERGVPRTEIWRAMTGVAMLQAAVGKYVIAINEDIDPDNADAVLTGAMISYNASPAVVTSRAAGIQLSVVLQVRLTERAAGKVLFDRAALEARERYEISDDQVAYFEESDVALDRLSRDVARTVVSAILEAF